MSRANQPKTEAEARELYASLTADELRRLVRGWRNDALREYVGPFAYAELERRLAPEASP